MSPRAAGTGAERSGRARTRSRTPRALRSHPAFLWGSAGAAVVLAGLAWFVFRPVPGLADVEESLARQGFVPNPGFAAALAPGDVIQVAAAAGRLPQPALVLRRGLCFPDLTPSESPLALPGHRGRRAGSFRIAGEHLLRRLPGLAPALGGAKSYALEVGNPRRAAFAKSDLSGRFSRPCLDRMEEELGGGNRQEWYAVVLEAVVADGLEFTIEWEAEVSAEAKAKLAGLARRGLPGAGGTVAAAAEGSAATVLRAPGPVVLAYKPWPLAVDFGEEREEGRR